MLSPWTGKCNLGNLSNCTKHVEGIDRFQVIQTAVGAVTVNVVADDSFTAQQSDLFLAALRQRLGEKMDIELRRVTSIAREPSGKHRLVKNTLQE